MAPICLPPPEEGKEEGKSQWEMETTSCSEEKLLPQTGSQLPPGYRRGNGWLRAKLGCMDITRGLPSHSGLPGPWGLWWGESVPILSAQVSSEKLGVVVPSSYFLGFYSFPQVLQRWLKASWAIKSQQKGHGLCVRPLTSWCRLMSLYIKHRKHLRSWRNFSEWEHV